jgi:hypothetical protein
LGVVKIPCRVRRVLVGNCAAATVAVAVVRAGSAGAAFAFVTREAVASASSTIASSLVGAFTVKVSLVVFVFTVFTSVTIVVRVHLGLTTSNEVDTENLGVQTRVEVTRWSVFAITIEISHRSINKGSTVRANALAAVSPEPVAVAITLGGFTTSTMSSTVVWACSTCETENREERENLHVESCVCMHGDKR